MDVTLTLFKDLSATYAKQATLSLADLAELIRTTSAASREQLPLLKLAVLGRRRSSNGSLRTNTNMRCIHGIEGEHDAGLIGVDEVTERLDKAGIVSVVYTTPSHTPEKQRWRALCPTRTELPPAQRDRLVNRLNGLLGGVLSPESWTLSQAYFYGAVAGNQAPRVEIVDGLQTIDQADELDEIAIGKPNGRDPGSEHVAGDPEAPIEDIAAALELIPNNDLPWDGDGGWNYLAMAVWRASGGSEDGFAAFDRWSAKSGKYDADATAARWEHFFRSPPDQLGFGTLVHYARLAEPGWEPPSRNRDFGFDWSSSNQGSDAEPEQAGSTDPDPIVIHNAAARARSARPPPRQWLLGTSFCRGSLSLLAGRGGVGKTALRMAQLLSLASGRELTGEHVRRPYRVLLLCFEDGLLEIDRRMQAAIKHFGVADYEIADQLFYAAVGSRQGKLVVANRNQIRQGPLVDRVRQAIHQTQADVLCLDPLVKTHGVAENDNNAIDFVCALLLDLAVEFNIAIDLLHHDRKGGADPGDADRARGASALVDAARLDYTLTTMSEDEANRFGIPAEERPSYVRYDSGKVNLCPAVKAIWFRLVGAPLGNGTEEYPNGDEIQVAEPWWPPNELDGIPLEQVEPIFDAVAAGLPDGRLYSNDNAAKDRAAWKVVEKYVPGKTEKFYRNVIKKWVEQDMLIKGEYIDPVQRAKRGCLRVNPRKRP
jgi:hypothetical protein